MSKIPRDAMKKSFVDKLVHDALVSWSYIKLAISFIKGQFIAKTRYIGCLVSVTFFLLTLQLVACGPTASPSPASSNAAVTTDTATSERDSTATTGPTATSGTGSTAATATATSRRGSTGATAAATAGTGSTAATAAATSGTGSTGVTSGTGSTGAKTPIPPPDPKDYTISVEGGQVPASAYPGEPGFTAFTITVTNTRSYPITWAVISDSSWLSLDRHGDTLKPGASEDCSVKITALKNLEPGKTYTGILQFSPFDSHTEGLKHYSEVDLTVNSPPASTVAPTTPTSPPAAQPTPTSQQPVAPPTPPSQQVAPPTPTSEQVAPPTPTSQEPVAPPTPTSPPVAPPTSTST